MADTKISALTALTGANVDKVADLIPVVDASASATKSILVGELHTAMFCGARVRKSGNQTTANYSTEAAVAFDSEDWDTDAFHDTVTNNTRLTVPSIPMAKARLTAAGHANLVAGSTTAYAYIRKNGSGVGFPIQTWNNGTFTDIYFNGCHIDSCVATDYYELMLFMSDNSVTVVAADTYFAIERAG